MELTGCGKWYRCQA